MCENFIIEKSSHAQAQGVALYPINIDFCPTLGVHSPKVLLKILDTWNYNVVFVKAPTNTPIIVFFENNSVSIETKYETISAWAFTHHSQQASQEKVSKL